MNDFFCLNTQRKHLTNNTCKFIIVDKDLNRKCFNTLKWSVTD